MYESAKTINDLDAVCLREVLACLTLKEKCGVERVGKNWQGFVRAMLVQEQRLELVYLYEPSHLSNHHQYCSEKLADFFQTGVLNDEVVGLFHRLNSTTPTCADKLKIEVEGIKHLTINQEFALESRIMKKVPILKAAVFEKLMSVFEKVTSIEFVSNDLEESKWAWSFLARNLPRLAELKALDFRSVGQGREKLDEMLTSARNLKVLRTVVIRPEQILHLRLEELRCQKTENLLEILQGQPFLKEIYIERASGLSEWLTGLTEMRALKKVVAEFSLANFNAVNCGLEPTLVELSQVESLTLVDVRLFVNEMRILVGCLNSLSKFELVRFLLDFTKENATTSALFSGDFEEVAREFLQILTTMNHLKCLVLEYRLPPLGEGTMRFSNLLLTLFLNFSEMPRLRRLSCNLFNLDDCFRQFSVLAKANPNQWYEFKEFVNYFPPMKLSEDVRKGRSRNVRLF